jgi:hypothetical protein
MQAFLNETVDFSWAVAQLADEITTARAARIIEAGPLLLTGAVVPKVISQD